jgi:thiol:disulfide interchange protein DsbD
MPVLRIFVYFWLFLATPPVFALAENEAFLPPEQAFIVTALATSDNNIAVTWQIAEGYSVYRNNLRLVSNTDNISVAELIFPDGQVKHDEILGDIEHYHQRLTVQAAIKNPRHLSTLVLDIHYQACSDQGVCYPPQKKLLTLDVPATAPSVKTASLKSWAANFSPFAAKKAQAELLPPEQAFQFFATVTDAQTLHVNWLIADDYYLYREKIQLQLTDSSSSHLGEYLVPRGEPKFDEAFGQVETFHHELAFDVPLLRATNQAHTLVLNAKFQGCADRGVCYPPMEKTISLTLPSASELSNATPAPQQNTALSEQDHIAQALHKDSFFMTLLSFFGFGVLLSLTPCIFPMIPILSGIIVGHGQRVTVRRGFALSLSYVVASALTYTVFGVLAALFGSNLQIIFQQPWVIVLFSGVFVVLSLSMFGFYHLELPKSLQATLLNSSELHRDGSLLGAAIMGALSSLIIGPCVAAPLAGALIFIGQTGDVLLGGSALFVMGLGMGLPLLILGASAGKLLPKAGTWLNATKAVFGVLMLSVALWMLTRILPAEISMLLWAILLIISSVYLHALDPLPVSSTGWAKFFKGIGVVMLLYGVLLVMGYGLGNTNPLSPLVGEHSLSGANNASIKSSKINFQRVTTLVELTQKLAQATANHQRVMLDFYADWCISCKEMEAYTFTNAQVKSALDEFVLLQVDVTQNSADDQALLKKFNLIGPPAIMFFDNTGHELSHQRVIGYQQAEQFLQTLHQVKQ